MFRLHIESFPIRNNGNEVKRRQLETISSLKERTFRKN